MKELLYKQLCLTSHPMTFVFLTCGAMLLIPNYPYSVAFFYVTLGVFFMFMNAREQHDNIFTALLPIRKRDTVKASVLFTVLIQLAFAAVACIFVIISLTIFVMHDNVAGIDANPAIIGFGFVVFGTFNIIFFSNYYKTGYKVGSSFLKACIAMFIVLILDVVLPHVIPFLDGYNNWQYIFLAICIVVYALLTFIALKISTALYDLVDL